MSATEPTQVLDFSLGDRIRKARITAGLQQQELGDLIGVSRAQVSIFERDHQEPRVGQLCRIADACNVSVFTLIGDRNSSCFSLIAGDSTPPLFAPDGTAWNTQPILTSTG